MYIEKRARWMQIIKYNKLVNITYSVSQLLSYVDSVFYIQKIWNFVWNLIRRYRYSNSIQYRNREKLCIFCSYPTHLVDCFKSLFERTEIVIQLQGKLSVVAYK